MKSYLGDSVYADVEDGMLKLTTKNRSEVSNTIFLGPEVVESLLLYIKGELTRRRLVPEKWSIRNDGSGRSELWHHSALAAKLGFLLGSENPEVAELVTDANRGAESPFLPLEWKHSCDALCPHCGRPAPGFDPLASAAATGVEATTDDVRIVGDSDGLLALRAAIDAALATGEFNSGKTDAFGFENTCAIGSLWLWTREIKGKRIYVDKATALHLIQQGYVPEGYE